MDCGATIPIEVMLSIQEKGACMHWFLWHYKKQKPESDPLIGLNSRLSFEHALAVFIMRPQADVKSAQCHKNKQVAPRRQTAAPSGGQIRGRA
jgi:hypothetical protein